MTASDNISDVVAGYLALLRQVLVIPKPAVSFLSDALPVRDARPCALLFSPHPDDECVTGALPLRLQQEQGWQIINVAITLGSNLERRAERRAELAKACAVLGFDAVEPVADGFSGVNLATRDSDPGAWRGMVARLAEIIAHYKPQAIFMPHGDDWNATHLGAHALGVEALMAQKPGFTCAIFKTEFWRANPAPNLMIGIGEKDVTKILSALACHEGEVARNPYDRRLPAYLIDNVRRGCELLGGKGAPAADIDFAMLYQYGIWQNGKFVPSALNRFVGAQNALDELFA